MCIKLILGLMLQVFTKCAGLPDKTGIFSFCPADLVCLKKCPVNLSEENNILTTDMPSVLQILTCPAKDYSLSGRCPKSVEKISRRLYKYFKVLSITRLSPPWCPVNVTD